jgi:hypothetical protein
MYNCLNFTGSHQGRHLVDLFARANCGSLPLICPLLTHGLLYSWVMSRDVRSTCGSSEFWPGDAWYVVLLLASVALLTVFLE